MKTIFNFFRNLLFDSNSDMIGLASIRPKRTVTPKVYPKNKKEYTLTEMLKRTY